MSVQRSVVQVMKIESSDGRVQLKDLKGSCNMVMCALSVPCRMYTVHWVPGIIG